MGSHQMNERQVLDALVRRRSRTYSSSTWKSLGWRKWGKYSPRAFDRSRGYVAERIVCRAFEACSAGLGESFEVNAAEHPAVRASCVEFVLAGLYAMERISRSQKHGRVQYEV